MFSIIIPTKDRIEDLKNCIGSIRNQTVWPCEVIVVDASSDKASGENQKNCRYILGDKIKLVYKRSASGVNMQRNTGADNAKSDIIFFLDDDVVLKEDYCEKVLEIYSIKKGSNTGGVQGTISNYFNQTWLNRTFRRLFFMTRASKNEKSRFLPSFGYVYILMPKEIIEVEAMSAGFCSYYRYVFNEFRFDETFDRCTDLEINYRISRKYRMYQTPYALLIHNHSKATHLDDRHLNKRIFINIHKLVQKHLPHRLSNRLAYYWSIVGEVILNTTKSCIHLDSGPILGTLDGIKYIFTKNMQIS